MLKGRARVVNTEGVDVTQNFVKAAEAVCELARALGVKEALFKDGSPACGVSRVTVDGKETTGLGVTAAALKALDITLRTIR